MWSTIVCANRSYNILNIELGRVGALNPGPKTLAMLDLHDPELDFVKMAQGMGVEASRAATTTRIRRPVRRRHGAPRAAPDRSGS